MSKEPIIPPPKGATPKDALRALMKVDPEKVLEAERREREKRDKENGDADSER